MDLQLAFDRVAQVYLPSAVPPSDLVAGAALEVEGGGGSRLGRFTLTVPVPSPIEVTASLDNVASGLEVAWLPGHATQIDLLLSATGADGTFASVSCVAPDGAGRFRFPAPLLAGLPPPPRDLTLEVGRDELRRAPADSPAVGVLIHVGYAVTLHAHD
jgi:hypothetical protein